MPENQLNEANFRRALSQFVTGITVVSCGCRDGSVYGMTVSSFNSVSLSPPLILWSLDNGSKYHSDFANGFAVNILSAEQRPLCDQFAASDEASRFDNVDYHIGKSGHPVILGALASLECRPWATYAGGDHQIYVGEVIALHTAPANALSFFQGEIGAHPMLASQKT